MRLGARLADEIKSQLVYHELYLASCTHRKVALDSITSLRDCQLIPQAMLVFVRTGKNWNKASIEGGKARD